MKTNKNLQKVLFLDIDGVLNRAEYGEDLYEDTYENYCVALHRPSIRALKKLLEKEPSLKIVWISDWAHCESCVCNKIGTYLDPLYALESFSWLKEHVAGSIFSNRYVATEENAKAKAIKKYVIDNFVESYAILDDDKYEQNDESKNMLKHLVHINSLKSFLEDDLQSVYDALDLPTDCNFIHEMLLSMEQPNSFVVNHKYRCTFDFSTYHNRKSPLFTKFIKDENCPRMSANVDVLVYDIKNSIHLKGSITLSVDLDLANKHIASLYLKNIDSDSWESNVPILYLTNIA